MQITVRLPPAKEGEILPILDRWDVLAEMAGRWRQLAHQRSPLREPGRPVLGGQYS
jgi:hypothetical protein